MSDAAEPVHFVPSRVEGIAELESVTVFPDRLEFGGSGGARSVRFVDIAEWPWPKAIRRALFRLGFKPRWLPVADRDWFRDPAERYFTFYTEPRLRLFMPVDERPERDGSTFARIERVIQSGGFATCDLG